MYETVLSSFTLASHSSQSVSKPVRQKRVQIESEEFLKAFQSDFG